MPHACKSWAVRTIYGFVGTSLMRFQTPALAAGSAEFTTTLISRRSRHRAGTRYITRGADALGNVANFVETEQLVWAEETSHVYTSFSLIRGSVPVFGRQDNGIAKPSPELDATLLASRTAFTEHFDTLNFRVSKCSVKA
ncbi:SacIy [Gracilaria domingensis]|nr:SacIy [Gracilaria domingensis]